MMMLMNGSVGVIERTLRSPCNAPELHPHQVNNVQARADEEALHHKSIEAILRKDVEVSCDKDNRIEDLRLEGDAPR